MQLDDHDSASQPSRKSLALAALDALQRSELLDSAPEEQYDRVTALIRDVLDVPVALVSLVAGDRQFFKSAIGLAEPWASRRETPLSHSFCKHVTSANAPLVVNNARTDPRVIDNLAVKDLDVVAYLGVPIHAEGLAIGALCAIDTRPRIWEQRDLDRLVRFGAILDEQISLRTVVAERDRALKEAEVVAHEHAHRMKNALSVAASLVTISARESDRVPELTRIARDRITALARAQNLGWLREGEAELKALLSAVLGAYLLQNDGDRMIKLNGATVGVPLPKVTPLSLIFHELATNASKYGALSDAGGTVAVDWRVEGSRIRLEWSETLPKSAAPEADEKDGRGFGTQLVDLCVRQLSGAIDIRTDEDGARTIRLDMPWETHGLTRPRAPR